jgi:hypothetical protein
MVMLLQHQLVVNIHHPNHYNGKDHNMRISYLIVKMRRKMIMKMKKVAKKKKKKKMTNMAVVVMTMTIMDVCVKLANYSVEGHHQVYY